MDFYKSNFSVMFAATASGIALSPYIVYKADNPYNTWTERGPGEHALTGPNLDGLKAPSLRTGSCPLHYYTLKRLVTAQKPLLGTTFLATYKLEF